MTQALVIGGGATGLVAAIELADRGHAVTVLESSPRLGGRAQTLHEGGFAFNLGPHALYRGAQRVLSRLGVEVDGGVPTAGLTIQVEDRLAPLPANPLTLFANGSFSWSEKLRVASLLARLGTLDASTLDDISVSDWLDARRVRGRARNLILATVRVSSYVHAPDRMSAGAAIRQIRGALDGVLYLHGGWGSIVDGLRAQAKARGVTLRMGARVERLELEGGVATGVRLRGGEHLSAAAIVMTLSPKASRRLLREHASPTLEAFANTALPARAACLDLGLRSLPRRHPALILGTDEPIYVSVHSNVARLAPDGAGLIHAMRYLGEEPARPAHRAHLESLLDDAQPGWRDQVVDSRWGPAMTVMHAIPEARFGGLSGRPAAHQAGVPNVAIAGDWVGPEGLLFDACLASARAAAEVASAARVRAA